MNKSKSNIFLAISGLITGFLNGFFGGGGGMVCVPILIYALKEPVKKAHATALLIILPISIVSAIFYFSFGSLDFNILLKSGSGVLIGGIIGAFLLNKISNDILKIIFSVIMLIAGIKLIF